MTPNDEMILAMGDTYKGKEYWAEYGALGDTVFAFDRRCGRSRTKNNRSRILDTVLRLEIGRKFLSHLWN